MNKQAPERLTEGCRTERYFCPTSLRELLRSVRAAPRCVYLLLGFAALLGGCGAPPEKTGEQPRPTATTSGIEMVAVPAGWFEMGSANQDEPDQKLHKVYVSAFFMDKYPVTQEAYEKLMGKNPSLWQGPRNPVEQIRWRDAAAFCNARSRAEGLQPAYDTNTWACDFDADGYRLPTEAEYQVRRSAPARRARRLVWEFTPGVEAPCLVQGEQPARHASCGRKTAQQLGPMRHGRQRLGVVQ